jgi:hypothetical protein
MCFTGHGILCRNGGDRACRVVGMHMGMLYTICTGPIHVFLSSGHPFFYKMDHDRVFFATLYPITT